MKKYQKKRKEKILARQKIKELFKQAAEVFDEDPKASNNYVRMARKLAMKYNLRIPPQLKRSFCKYCYSYLKQGRNVKVRLQQGKQGKVVYHCLVCDKIMRFPYKPKENPKKPQDSSKKESSLSK